MSWRLLAEVRDRNFEPVAARCRARRDQAGDPAPIPFNAAHGKLLMLLLAEWCNDEGAAVYPRSKAAFASACGLSERQIQRLFAGLIEAGLVKIDRKEDAQAKTPRLYRISIGALLDLPLTDVARGDRERQQRARARDRTGDQQSPVGETSRRKTGDQESGTGDQQSPTTPITPKEPTTKSSDEDLSAPAGAPAPTHDLKSRIFGTVLDWLAEQSGRPKHKLRSMVGRWCRDHGDGRVLEIMTQAARCGPVEPVAWIEQTLKEERDGKRLGNRDGPTAGQAAAAGILGRDLGS
ncbi:MAG: helix-turn-helix domain-containing protein [Myxococcales bacterium]|nr:helix-turn-helix domain-containing protein [Myxococcales bacterium]